MMKRMDAETLERLVKEGKERGLSSRFLEFNQRLFRIQAAVEQRIAPVTPGLDKKSADDRIECGLPLISPEELNIDWPLLSESFTEVTAVFAEYADLFSLTPGRLRKLKRLSSPSRELVKAWLKAASLPVIPVTQDTDVSRLEMAIIQVALKPFLVSHGQALLSLVNQERWRRGYCPVCGGRPDFAFLDRERGARWLICSRCDAEWLFQRLRCPYCGSQDQDALAYFTDDEGNYRLYICERCRTYLKAVDLRNNSSELSWPLQRLFTFNMDQQAQDGGYRPGYLEPRAS